MSAAVAEPVAHSACDDSCGGMHEKSVEDTGRWTMDAAQRCHAQRSASCFLEERHSKFEVR